MSITAGVDDNSLKTIGCRLVNVVDQLTFMITLVAGYADPEFEGQGTDLRVDVSQSQGTVNLWFATTKQVKIGPMQD